MNTTTKSTPFLDVVKVYAVNLQANLQKTLDTEDDSSVSMADWAMVKKVQKHVAANNQRKAAQYVVMRLEEDPAPLSQWACEQMRKTPLKATKTQVLFTNEGERRAFNFVRAQ